MDSAFPFPIHTDDSLPTGANLLIAEGFRGVVAAEDGDVTVWMVGRGDWEAMTPGQRAEFGTD